MRSPALLALVLLAACATPQERCVTDATKDLRVVNGLIAETRDTLDRGYAIAEFPERSARLTFCSRPSGNFVFCTADRVILRERAVAVDLDDEARKLRALEAKKAELETRTRRDLDACRALATGAG